MSPVCVAFDSANNIYVTDLVNNRIQVFAIGGHFLRNFSYCFVPFLPIVNNPFVQFLQMVIAIDSNDTVYVSDAMFNRVTASHPMEYF